MGPIGFPIGRNNELADRLSSSIYSLENEFSLVNERNLSLVTRIKNSFASRFSCSAVLRLLLNKLIFIIKISGYSNHMSKTFIKMPK